MKAITLRNIPPRVQRAIQSKARQKGISVNKAVLELLEERVGILQDHKKSVHHDLDSLAGSWNSREEKSFQQVVGVGRQIDEDLWR
jgi:antitoxin FitA-like protein